MMNSNLYMSNHKSKTSPKEYNLTNHHSRKHENNEEDCEEPNKTKRLKTAIIKVLVKLKIKNEWGRVLHWSWRTQTKIPESMKTYSTPWLYKPLRESCKHSCILSQELRHNRHHHHLLLSFFLYVKAWTLQSWKS